MKDEAKSILWEIQPPRLTKTLGWATALRKEFGIGQDQISNSALELPSRHDCDDPFHLDRIPELI